LSGRLRQRWRQSPFPWRSAPPRWESCWDPSGSGSGDRILLFTDGIPEALSPGAEMFGEERLRNVLASHATQSTEATADSLVAQVAAWTGRTAAFDDDLTLVVVGIDPEAQF
jgi:serine/threonine protein phosphatase PrpC